MQQCNKREYAIVLGLVFFNTGVGSVIKYMHLSEVSVDENHVGKTIHKECKVWTVVQAADGTLDRTDVFTTSVRRSFVYRFFLFNINPLSFRG